jgi:hypothetical protein
MLWVLVQWNLLLFPSLQEIYLLNTLLSLAAVVEVRMLVVVEVVVDYEPVCLGQFLEGTVLLKQLPLFLQELTQ